MCDLVSSFARAKVRAEPVHSERALLRRRWRRRSRSSGVARNRRRRWRGSGGASIAGQWSAAAGGRASPGGDTAPSGWRSGQDGIDGVRQSIGHALQNLALVELRFRQRLILVHAELIAGVENPQMIVLNPAMPNCNLTFFDGNKRAFVGLVGYLERSPSY